MRRVASSCFGGGWGGSAIIMVVGRRMTISYMMHKMDARNLDSDRTTGYRKAIFGAVTISQPGEAFHGAARDIRGTQRCCGSILRRSPQVTYEALPEP